MAIAISASVTVSMAALTKGMLSLMLRVNFVEMSVSVGRKSAYWVRREMSSKVRLSNLKFAMKASMF